MTIKPKYGCEQIYWNREFTAAYQSESTSNVKRRGSLLVDSEINKWYHADDLTNINYQPGIVDKPTRNEGFTLYEEDLPLITKSNHKFELPALFLQWEGIIQKNDDSFSLHSSVVRLCEVWSEANPWGRIIVICDGVISESLETDHIKNVLYQLIKDFHSSPVYVLQVTDQTDSGSYTRPPKPGLLAFLQKRHHIDLQSKSTVYLYQHQSHKELADAAGVQSIKISKVLHNQLLILNPPVATRPVVPPFIEAINLQKSDSIITCPTIPSYREISKFNNHHVCRQLGFGRREYIFAPEINCIERYQTLYAEFATPVNEPVSKIQEIINGRDTKKDTQSKTPLRRSSLDTSHRSNRDLPKWMMGKTNSDATKSSLSKSESSSSTTDGKFKQTVYIMTEKELVEIATDVLKQAGREDILKQISQQKSSRNQSCSKNISHKLVESEESQPGTSKQNVIQSATVAGALSTTRLSTADETKALPSEPVPGTSKQNMIVKSNLISSCDDMDSENNTNNPIGDSYLHQEADELPSYITKSKSRTAVLDSFMNEDFTRKRSPKKKRRIDRLLETYSEMETTAIDAADDLFDESEHSQTDDCKLEQMEIQAEQLADLSQERQNFTVLSETNKPKEMQKTRTLCSKSEQSSPKSKRKQERDFSVLDEIFK